MLTGNIFCAVNQQLLIFLKNKNDMKIGNVIILAAALLGSKSFAQGTITALNCSSSTNIGLLNSGISAIGVSSLITYSGGNGGAYSAQTKPSTGITGLTATLSPGTFANGAGVLTYVITGTPSGVGTASFALNIGGRSCNLTRAVYPIGTISALNCGSAIHNGTLTAGIAASSVNSYVPYTGGNGGTYNNRTVSSTGVTGLTATIWGGTFASGTGNVLVSISGTPNAIGVAFFALNIGGRSCTLSRSVLPGSITSLNCASASHSGTITQGSPASVSSSFVLYDGGNGGMHNGQVINSTGVLGLTATLTAGKFVIGGGQLTYKITGTPATSGVARFALNIGGKTCVLNRTIYPAGTITALNCGTATHTGALIAGALTTGTVKSVVSYSGGNGGTYTGQSVASTGVTGLTATILNGVFSNGAGNLTYFISGTPANGGSANFAINIGGRSCTFSRSVVPGSITGLTCSSVVHTGTLTKGLVADGISSTIPYTGGNGGSYSAQAVASTGVIGLTANISAGNFAFGNGSVTINITGTPVGSGIASFAIGIGGRSCTINRSVLNDGTGSPATCGATNVHNSGKTYGTMRDQEGNEYKTITINSRVWMAENLKTSMYRNGDQITEMADRSAWVSTTSGAWCHINNDPETECPYGKLYNGYSVIDPRGLCPTGWYVAGEGDYIQLQNHLGGMSVAGGKMKSTGNFYWASPNTSATNSCGFSALPAGYRNFESCGCEDFRDYSNSTFFWTSTRHDSGIDSYVTSLSSTDASIAIGNGFFYKFGLSVRCIKIPTSSSRMESDIEIPKFKLFPNPAKNQFHLQINSNDENTASVQITDLGGRVLMAKTSQLSKGMNTLNFDLSEFPMGMYLVLFNDGEGRTVLKIVKE